MRHLHDPDGQIFWRSSDVMPTHLDEELIGTHYRREWFMKSVVLRVIEY